MNAWRKAVAAALSFWLAFSPLEPLWSAGLAAKASGARLAAPIQQILSLPPALALRGLAALGPTHDDAHALAALAALPGAARLVQEPQMRQQLVSAFGEQGAAAVTSSVQAWSAAAEQHSEAQAELQSLRDAVGANDLAQVSARLESLYSGRAQVAGISRLLFEDLIRKYAAGADIRDLGPSEEACLGEARSWDFGAQPDASAGRFVERLIQKFHPELDATQRSARAAQAMRWFHEKYGVLDRPLLAAVDPAARGSYRTPGSVAFNVSAARLPAAFDPSQPSSIQDLDSYIARKWGGLGAVAAPDHVIFSELGTSDTLAGLKAQGFERLHFVNAPYATRGSKTLLAMKPGDPAPYVVFYSFVGPDLFNHKLMQLALQYGGRFKSVRMLGSNNLKSWGVADMVVEDAVMRLPDIAIDDLVIGYPGPVEEHLLKSGKPLQTARVGNFATIKYFTIQGKNGLSRTVAVLTDIELRYFGKSVLPLIRAFLNRRIDRVLFAGSAGSLDPQVPAHALMIPRSFHLLDETGGVSPRLDVDNDLFDLLPYGVSYSGRHISVPSPLVETQSMVKRLREHSGIVSIDVEASQIAGLIREHNKQPGHRTRFGAAFIVTDTPVSEGEKKKAGYGLHKPDYKGKSATKKTYADALNLLWDLPGQFAPSNHTRLIGRHYSRKISELVKSGDIVARAALYAEIQTRLAHVRRLSRQDRHVSRGLAKTYLDLLRALDQAKTAPLPAGYAVPIEAPGALEPLSRPLQKALLLQSLTRSSTLSSGEVGYGKKAPAAVRTQALLNAERAAEYALSRADWPLEASDINRIHALLNEGILPDEKRGRIRDFYYRGEDDEAVSSDKEFADFARWLSSVKPSPEAALEAYLRLEELHPYDDGSGRTAELVAQHLMIRATGHPFLFPNRFDIDYILSLRRNGSHTASDARQLARLIRHAREFSSWLKARVPGIDDVSARIDPENGLVTMQSGERSLALKPFFRSPSKIPLEREDRTFLASEQKFSEQALAGFGPPTATLVQAYSEYEGAFNLYARLSAPTPGAAPRPEADGGFLNFGGSFSPPTKDHMGIVAHLMQRFGIKRAKMVPTYPYKPGAAPAEIGLELTSLAVENFREILAINSIPYQAFKSWPGGSSWQDPDGTLSSLSVETFDIRTKNKENALDTLEHLRESHGGNAQANYWISGADSFASVPTWTPRWRELFASTHWIVISRPGFDAIDFKRRDPLRGVLDDSFLNNYDYSFDAAKQSHVYRHKDPAKPGIFVVDQPTLGDSSSENRKSLATEGDHEHAQAGLQPSVFKRVLEKGYYAKNGFSDRNLDDYLSYLHGRIENPDGDPVSVSDARDYETMTGLLLASARKAAAAQAVLPWHRKLTAAVAEHAGEFIENVTSIRQFPEKLRQLSKTMGAVAVERQRALAGGDFSLYRRLASFRNRLLRGDPDLIVASVELDNALGLRGAPVTLNIVESALPGWVPLAIRRLVDRLVTWHDLNVSTNELKAILDDSALAKVLEERSAAGRGLFAYRLLAAIFDKPAARARFELFLSQRYFKRLAFGQVPDELLGGFPPAEREAIVTLKAQLDSYRKVLDPEQLTALSDSLADFYALAQAARLDPARVKTDEFWTAFLDLRATRYPGKRAALDRAEMRELGEILPVFGNKLISLLPGTFAGTDVSYRGRKLLRLNAPIEILDPSLRQAAEESRLNTMSQVFENALAAYIDSNHQLFAAPATIDGPQLRLLSLSSRGEDLGKGNLVWEMHLLDSHVSRQLAILDAGFERGELYLEKRRAHPSAKSLFRNARKAREDELSRLREESLKLEYEWLKVKFPHQVGIGSDNETAVPGYAAIASRYQALRSRIEDRLKALRTLNHMMLGTVPCDVTDISGLRALLNERAAGSAP